MKDYKFFKHFARPKEEGDEDGNCCTAKPIESTRIIYDGPNLPCTGIRTCDDITIALQKIDVQICDLINQLYNLTSTTTTSTTTILPSTTTTTTTTAISLELRLTWDDIVNVPVVDINSVSNWNTFFNLPISGIPFSTVTIDVEENIVTLTGGININLRDSIFNGNHHLISIQDEGCIITTMFDCFIACTSIISVDMPSCITTGPACFYGCTNLTDANLPALITATDNLFTMCTSLTSISLPSLITAGPASFIGCTNLSDISLPVCTAIGDYGFNGCVNLVDVSLLECITIGDGCFGGCISLESITIPSCISLGTTVDNNDDFYGISGQTITLTIPSALMTCNLGAPDGDIQYLIDNNTVTIITT